MPTRVSEYPERLRKLSTTNVSDALDSLSLKGATCGIRPMWEGAPKIAGQAVTIKLIPAGTTQATHHLGVHVISKAQPEDIIVIDNGGKLNVSSWGGILANAAKVKGVSGVVIDGACRDLDDYVEIGFPVYAKGAVVQTARGRVMESGTNVDIEFAGIPVHPGDFVIADRSGVVFIAQEYIEKVLAKAEALHDREQQMIAEIQKGTSITNVDLRFGYEQMLK